ncbi:hypothetical protein BJV74DRAFT_273228 [Russula compacta]|nr:hypothetical protein BJV74DRAFT_273228 [Russula compacta]
MCRQVPRNRPQELVFFPKLATRPLDHRSALIGMCANFFSTSGAIRRSVPHWSLTSSSFTCIATSKSRSFKQKSRSTRRLSGLMSLCDTKHVKIRDALDNAIADLRDTAFKLVAGKHDIRPDRIHFRENGPRRRLCLERIDQRDNVLGLRVEGMQKIEDLKLI